jgi:predicted alpha/beta superfamily hydrolase
MQPTWPAHWSTNRPHRFGGRTVRVWVPADYDACPERRHAVLYLLDGHNVFGDDGAFHGIGWHADTAAQRLLDRNKLAPVLLVGIDSGPHRTDDYTPVAMQGRGGHANAFGHWLVHVVKPGIDRSYRTTPGPEATAIAGASLGGLCALHLALHASEVFGHVAALSPSLWWADSALLHHLADLGHGGRPRIWLDAGKREAPHLQQSVRATAELLLAHGWHKHRDPRRATLRHVESKGAAHDERAWRQRLPRVLQFLFPVVRQPRRRRRAAAVTG